MATIKQKKVVKILVENKGKSVSAAMKEAGYSEKSAHNPQQLTSTQTWAELLEEYLPDTLLAKVHKEGLEAVKKESGEMVPDQTVRHKYLDTAYKVKGKLKQEGESSTLVVNITGRSLNRYGGQADGTE